MARKKPAAHLARDERPEFLALVAELADVPAEQFPALAKQAAEQYHDAVLAGHVDALDRAEDAYTALVYKLNGDSLHGCKADADSAGHVLARAVAAQPGQVPGWGQAGEFLLEVDGLRVWVVVPHHMLGNHRFCDFRAVDLDKPFISETGYRSVTLTATSSIGETVDQAARREVLELIQAAGKLKTIEGEYVDRRGADKRPAWLVDALAGVRADGQLAMFGDAPKDPNAKAPLTNAQRQKAFRQRQREKQAALKAEGLHALELSGVDLSRLFIALDTHLSFHSLLDWDLQGYQELAGRLFKGENNAEAWVQRLGTSVGVDNYKKHLETNSKLGFKAYEEERGVSKKLRERLSAAQAEVRQLQQALQAIAAEVSGTPAPIGAEVSAAAPKADEVAALRLQVAALERENALLESERNKAHAAIGTWEQRLRAAGQSTDYRALPGEPGHVTVTPNKD